MTLSKNLFRKPLNQLIYEVDFIKRKLNTGNFTLRVITPKLYAFIQRANVNIGKYENESKKLLKNC